MQVRRQQALVSGFLAVFLFLVFPFFAPLPLLVVYGRYGKPTASLAAIVAVLALFLNVMLFQSGAGVSRVAEFVVLFAWPSLIFWDIYRLRDNSGFVWCPLEVFIARMVIWGGLIFLAVVWMDPEGVAPLREQVEKMVLMVVQEEADPEYLESVLPLLSSVIPSQILGWWIALIVGNGWLAHVILRKQEVQGLRPAFTFSGAHPPVLLLVFLSIALLFTMQGDSTLAFTSQCLSLMLLIPYFISGLTYIHRASRRWPARTAGLVVLYLMLIRFMWLAAILAIIGIVRQCIFLGGQSR